MRSNRDKAPRICVWQFLHLGEPMKIALFAVLILSSTVLRAEQLTCMYPGFLNGELVTLKFEINGSQAVSMGLGEEYEVLQNTKTGIVMVRSFAYSSKYNNRDDVGLFGVVIHRPSLKMTRGNIIRGDTEGAIRQGKCLRTG